MQTHDENPPSLDLQWMIEAAGNDRLKQVHLATVFGEAAFGVATLSGSNTPISHPRVRFYYAMMQKLPLAWSLVFPRSKLAPIVDGTPV